MATKEWESKPETENKLSRKQLIYDQVSSIASLSESEVFNLSKDRIFKISTKIFQ